MRGRLPRAATSAHSTGVAIAKRIEQQRPDADAGLEGELPEDRHDAEGDGRREDEEGSGALLHADQRTTHNHSLPLEVLTDIIQISFTMLDLKRLRLLRELAHRGTIGAVATSLSYSPSAVSQQLALLEKEAGVPLLERVGRNVRLTAAAQTLVAHTDALLERMEEAEAELEATAELITGTVRVAAIQSAGLYLLAPALQRLSAVHPALRVEVTDAEPETSMPALALGSLDFVLGDQYPFLPLPPDPRLELEPLLEERFRVMLHVDHPLAASGEAVAAGRRCATSRGRSASPTATTAS